MKISSLEVGRSLSFGKPYQLLKLEEVSAINISSRSEFNRTW